MVDKGGTAGAKRKASAASSKAQTPPKVVKQRTKDANGGEQIGGKRKKPDEDDPAKVPEKKRAKKEVVVHDVLDDDEVECIEDEAKIPKRSSKGIEPEMLRELSKELRVAEWRVKNAVALFQDGSTLPFIARYRKEATGTMDEEQLRSLQRGMEQWEKLAERRAAILKALSKAGTLTPALQHSLLQATSLTELEDLYLPYRPKRKTRASDARDKGLQALASLLSAAPSPPFTAAHMHLHPREAARLALQSSTGVSSVEEALAGARDVFAEEVAETPDIRARARAMLRRGLMMTSKERKKGADEQAQFEMYHAFERRLEDVPAHSVLALARAEKLKILTLKIQAAAHAKAALLQSLCALLARPALHPAWQQEQRQAIEDGLERLLLPSLEREWWRESLEAAQVASLASFATNLRNKLLQPPVKGHAVLAIDPGYRTGCKVALVNETGSVKATAVIFPDRQASEAARVTTAMLKANACSTIVIGNGSGSREAERFVRAHLLPSDPRARYSIVDEAGASVYSASKLAGQELPDMDVALRGAVSLGRRLQDPLAELVKIDPKSIGVGMYQHDLDAKKLAQELRIAVETAVNAVGVDLNTASAALLQYVAGLNSKTAANVVRMREEQGPFAARRQLLTVAGVGAKTFEQAAGFLRVYGGEEVLDSTAVHPENYAAAKALLKERGIEGGVHGLGEETLKDILEAVLHPNRDPRDHLLGVPPPAFISSKDVGSGDDGRVTLENLAPGLPVQGVVRNAVDFGVFVDIGVQRDGLLHNSQIPSGHPKLQVGSIVQCYIKSVDKAHKSGTARISLTMKKT